MIRAVFWDSDNTIFDTALLHWGKHAATLAPLGIFLTPKDAQRIYENNGRQNWQWLRDDYGLQMAEEDYIEKIDAWYKDHVKDIEFRPGVRAVIEALAKRNIPQAVVTNARRQSVLEPYRDKGIEHYFKFFITIEDCANRKPAPDPYLKALQKINDPSLQPSDCLVIEDDPKGVEAAHHAGMPVIQRRLRADEAPSPFATLSVFDERDFLNTVQRFLG